MACCASCAGHAPGACVAPQSFDRAVPIHGRLTIAAFAAVGGAVGPELAQATKARAAFDLTRHQARVAQELHGRGRRISWGDYRSPQRFMVRPQIREQMREAIAGADIGWPSVPGRVPPAGWDGEPGAHNPFREI